MDPINKKLESLVNNEKTAGNFQNYSLDSIKRILKIAGDPHKKFKAIHIAGTNGKGSVAHMLNSILIASGYRTGLYTSPHLVRINERIRINNREISAPKLNMYIDRLSAILEKNPGLNPTYFDALTLFAFQYFHDERADIAVIETGLGGRLDSTNVLDPVISVITDISLDHMHILGDTVQKIAAEKAGIIKKRSIVVTSNRDEQVLDILSKKTEKLSSRLYVLNRDFSVKNIKRVNRDGKYRTGFDFILKLRNSFLEELKKNKKIIRNYLSVKNIEINTPGRFQTRNSSLAVASSLLLGKYGISVTENGIKKGLSKLKVPGRLQVILKKPLVIFDPAHNPAALDATLTALKEMYPGKKYNYLLSFMADKDYQSMFRIVRKPPCGKIFYYELNDDRCYKPSAGRKTSLNNIFITDNFSELINLIKKTIKPDSLLLVSGSFRLFSIAKKIGKNLSS